MDDSSIANDEQGIVDEDGSIFSELITAVGSLGELRTLVFVGHEFRSVVLPAALSESLTTIMFDGMYFLVLQLIK